MSVVGSYANWAVYNRLLTEAIASMSDDDLRLGPPAGDHWPIWALAAHVAGARIYWLCVVLEEPGLERAAAFMDPETGESWEDDLAVPRSAAELADALRVSWQVVADCLERWTPPMLDEPMPREGQRGIEYHTRQSILLRMISHDAYHAGEIALIQGIHGRPPLDLWPAGAHTVPAPG
jgi:uncharacterized damage-inducible protein DinB